MPTRVRLGGEVCLAAGKSRLLRRIAGIVVACVFAFFAFAGDVRAEASDSFSGGYNSGGYNSKEQLRCLAMAIYFEARGEPEDGKVAVAHVVMNRVGDPAFPDTVCDVVRDGGQDVRYRCQFTFWCDGNSTEPSEVEAWQDSEEVAQAVYKEASDDPTGGALWYHASYVAPEWSSQFERGPQIGEHIFYRPVQDFPPKPNEAPQIAETP